MFRSRNQSVFSAQEQVTESASPEKIASTPARVPAKQVPTSPGMIAKFVFMDKTYILEEFDLSFGQELNAKGQPGGFPKGGLMTLTLSEPPDAALNEWISRDNIVRDGQIRFFTNPDKITENAQLEILFRDAYCFKYQKKMRTHDLGLYTTFAISPRYVKIGNEEFENKWKKEIPHPYYIRSAEN